VRWSKQKSPASKIGPSRPWTGTSRAIQAAREQGFIQNEGLANELAARFYAARGFHKIADVYLRDARYCYLRWGAEGKVRQLEQLHPHLRETPFPPSPTTTFGAPTEQLDLATIVKASQALSSEIILGNLIEILMRIAVEHAGADRGLLVFSEGDTLRIEAEAAAGSDRIEVRLRGTAATESDLPASIIQYVVRTKNNILLDDALVHNPFSPDHYFHQKRCQSVLCLPLMRQTKLIGVLYLENNLASYVFTPIRAALLQLLASQAAISLENAQLYADVLTAEKSARQAERELRLAVDAIPAMVGIVQPNGFRDIINKRWLEYLGLSLEDVRGGAFAAAIHPEDVERYLEQRRVVFATGEPFVIEVRWRGTDGKYRWFLHRATALRDEHGNIIKWYGATFDIEDRKQAEDALRESEQRFRDCAETDSDWLWETGPDHRFIRVSGQPASGGISPPQQIGRSRWDIETDVKEEPEKWRLHFATLESHKPFRNFRYRTTRGDGSVLHISSSGKPFFDPEGRFRGYRGVSSDVTATVHAEQVEGALQDAMADLTRVTRLTTMGELTASIAHEIVQPLSAVVTNGNTCLHWLDDKTIDLAEARSAAQRAVRDAERANDIIRRIQALMTKNESQRIKLDMNGVVKEVLALSYSELLKRKVTVRTELAATLPSVFGDRVQLQQLMLNLILNGVEAMTSVAGRLKELTIETREDGADHVLVLVRDSGVGLNSERADKIFDAFFTTKPEGTGMGLTICRSIIEAHDGSIWASPGIPHGAVFQFRLPTKAMGNQ
jgi:PAS domain S-box-containing protein